MSREVTGTGASRKILVHDFSGHAFTTQLARALAGRGHDVTHASFSEFLSPKGHLTITSLDPPSFRTHELSIGGPFDKDNLRRRHLQQLRYARLASQLVLQERPELVLSGNAPIEVQQRIQTAVQRIGGRFFFWLQDIHSLAISRILGRRNRLLGRLAGAYYGAAERRTLRTSDRVVAISEDFRDLLQTPRWGVDAGRIEVVENWAPLADMPLHPRDNGWAEAHFRPGRQRIVYSGTLARKHDPEILVRLAQRLDADVYLFSAGSGPAQVEARATELGLDNLFVRPWVPVEHLSLMLAGADVLCAFIEKDAGVFSVPSKVLSYLAAGRPILASIPHENLAARTIRGAEAGLVSEPGDDAAMLDNAARLLADPGLRQRLGRNGRAHAEAKFDIAAITARFEGIFAEAVASG